MQTKGTATHTRPEPTVAYVTESRKTLLVGYRIERANGDVAETLVTADAATGKISHFTDWTLCDELAHAGLLERDHGGPATYGHVTYRLPPEAIALAADGQIITFAEYHLIKDGAR